MADDGARLVAGKRVDHIDQPGELDRKAGFLARFAQGCVLDGLAPFEMAAWDAPFVEARRLGALDQHDLALGVPDDRADADDGRGGRGNTGGGHRAIVPGKTAEITRLWRVAAAFLLATLRLRRSG